MAAVRITELRDRLSQHLRTVQRGETLTVLDHDRPIATIAPYRGEADSLQVRKPAAGAPALQEVPLPPPLDLDVDIVDLLLEERQSRR